MYGQLTLWDSLSVTSSPESADGLMPCGLPDGQMMSPCGQDHVHASHSLSQVSTKAPTMSATSGLSSPDLSAHVDLQSSLASRLLQRLEGIGSPVYALTWKQWDMQSGPPICALRASVRRISASDCIGAGWPTPTATCHKGGYEGGRIVDGRLCINRLDLAAQIVEPTRLTADGQILTGSDAKTNSGGKLNPALSRWLMGYPTGWDDCAVTATQSFPKSRRRS